MFSVFAALTSVAAFLLATLGVIIVATNTSESAAVSTGATTLEVKLSEFAIAPAALTATGGSVKIDVTNTGTMNHDLQVTQLAKKTRSLAPGESATLDLGTVKPGTYDVICTVPGHADSGMKATLTVGSGSGSSATTMAGMTAGPTAVGNPDDAKIDFAAAPAESFTARDPNAPPPLPGTVHELTMEASENVLEVAPGVPQQMWTFNLAGQAPTVPGPILRGKVGDTFRVTLVNKGQVDHSIDFHASKVAWSDEMRSIHPGESLVYEFTANFAGAYMYHCGTAPALHHIGNGMYGAIIIDPPQLAPVDHEFVMVQSELYTGPTGQPGDLSKMTANAWDAVVFNGYVNQYKARPLRVEPNQRVRVWVIDDGPSENSAFHIVGTIFDTVWKEGSYLLQPDQRQGGSQVLDLQPAQGGFVEFSMAEKGYYLMVTHKFSNVGKGALGIIQAGDVPPMAAAGH
ncbi:MAG TPA: cupredoxin domain-containing protein [Acidimicrobiales bacterium]